MFTVLPPPGVNPTAVKKYIISYYKEELDGHGAGNKCTKALVRKYEG